MQNLVIIISYLAQNSPEKDLQENINALTQKYGLKSVNIILEPTETTNVSPNIEIGPYKLKGNPSIQQLEIAIKAAIDRQNQMDEIHQKRNGKKARDKFNFGFWDNLNLWFNKHYLLVINLFMALFIGVAFLAPIFMKIGWETAAGYIYSVNKILCHELAFRSFFLFGQQVVYPRSLAHLDVLITYEALVGHDLIDILEARNFVGDAIHGYKVALCQRDIAMYGSFLIFGLIFSAFKENIKTIKFWMWILLGLFPIAMDGGTQLLGLGLNVAWFPERESTPLLRTITGIFFGIFTAWYLFPLLSEAIHEKRKQLTRTKEIHSQLVKQVESDQKPSI